MIRRKVLLLVLPYVALRISSTIYKSAPALREPRTSTSRRRWSKKIKPKVNVCIGNYGLNVNWTEAQKAQYFFHNLSKSLSRKTLSFYCGPEDDERTCILPSGDTVNWTNLSCRITWIALRGITSYVVVAMDPYTEYEFSAIKYYPGMHGPADFVVLTVLNQLGDLSSILNKEIPHHAQGNPFAVVSAAPATFEDPQERKLASSRAIDFLKAKLNDCSDFTFIKILKIAVCALKQMLGPNFKTNKIVQASYEGWVGGTDVLSTTEVDKCLNELNAEATRIEMKKVNLLLT